MINEKDKRHEHSDDPLASLFRDIETRPEPPVEVEQAVYQHFQQQWLSQRAAKQRNRRLYYLAMAASVLLVLLMQPLFRVSTELPGAPGNLATVEKLAGTVVVRETDRVLDLQVEMLPMYLSMGQTLASEAGSGAYVHWGLAGKSVRVDQNTVLNLISPTLIELISGRVYLDIPGALPSATDSEHELQILTRFGTVRHTGTQFAVEVNDENLEVKVREGSVVIDTGRQSHTAFIGIKGTLDSGGNFSSETIPIFGPSWSWVEKLAPTYEIEGKSVMDFLAWVQRETGRRCIYQSTTAENVARETLIHGADLAMEPMHALDLVLQTNELSWEEQNGEILISLEP